MLAAADCRPVRGFQAEGRGDLRQGETHLGGMSCIATRGGQLLSACWHITNTTIFMAWTEHGQFAFCVDVEDWATSWKEVVVRFQEGFF